MNSKSQVNTMKILDEYKLHSYLTEYTHKEIYTVQTVFIQRKVFPKQQLKSIIASKFICCFCNNKNLIFIKLNLTFVYQALSLNPMQILSELKPNWQFVDLFILQFFLVLKQTYYTIHHDLLLLY